MWLCTVPRHSLQVTARLASVCPSTDHCTSVPAQVIVLQGAPVSLEVPLSSSEASVSLCPSKGVCDSHPVPGQTSIVPHAQPVCVCVPARPVCPSPGCVPAQATVPQGPMSRARVCPSRAAVCGGQGQAVSREGRATVSMASVCPSTEGVSMGAPVCPEWHE